MSYKFHNYIVDCLSNTRNNKINIQKEWFKIKFINYFELKC